VLTKGVRMVPLIRPTSVLTIISSVMVYLLVGGKQLKVVQRISRRLSLCLSYIRKLRKKLKHAYRFGRLLFYHTQSFKSLIFQGKLKPPRLIYG